MLKKVLLVAAFAVGSLSYGLDSHFHSHSDELNVTSVRCEGVTKAGSRCKRMVKADTYCYQHITQKPKK
jgi:hypothetical protein